MKSVLIWKDGRREETDASACLCVLKNIDDAENRTWTVTFKSTNRIEPGDELHYVEASREDITSRLREAGQRIRNRTFEDLGLRLPDPGAFARGRFVGETDAEMRRRVNLMYGREPEDDGQ